MRTADRLTVLKSGGDILLAFGVRGVPPVDLEWRIRVACNLVRRAVEKVAGVEVEGHDGALLFRFEATDEASIHGLARRLEKRVATVLSTPLTPKAVDRTLGISSRERLRWYKDGRLPTCGRGRIGDGKHTAQFPLFPAREIACLVANPQIIEAWREQDKQVQQRTGMPVVLNSAITRR